MRSRRRPQLNWSRRSNPRVFSQQVAFASRRWPPDVVGRYGGTCAGHDDDLVNCRVSGARRPTSFSATRSASRDSRSIATCCACQPNRHRASEDPEVVEQQLCAAMPPAEWTRTSDTLILHGRRICTPRPLCDKCAVRDDCDYYHHVIVAVAKRAPRKRAASVGKGKRPRSGRR